MVAQVVVTLIQMTAATSVERVDTMLMTAIASTKEVVAAEAGPVHGRGLAPGPGEGVTGHAAEVMTGGVGPHRTQEDAEAGLPPQPAGPGHRYVGPGLQYAGQVDLIPAPDLVPTLVHAVSPGLAPGPDPVPPPPRETVGQGPPVQGKAQHLTRTDSKNDTTPSSPASLPIPFASGLQAILHQSYFNLIFPNRYFLFIPQLSSFSFAVFI